MSEFPPCVDCGEPDAGSCPGDRCRECDIDHLHKWLRCAECDEPTNVNDIALKLFGWHGCHLPTCSQYLPAIPVRNDDAGRELGGSD